LKNPTEDEVLKIAEPIVASFEGKRNHAYRDAVGIPTIGFGHCEGVRMTDSITDEQAHELLRHDLEERLVQLRRWLPEGLTANQQAACLSLAFNIGLGAFHKSTVLHRLHEGDIAGAAEAITWWNKAGGHILKGLVRRREMERELFLKDKEFLA
jgi:lysozyme